MTEPVVIDLYAGPGGWDLAAHALGIKPIGIEYENNACATREACGLETIQADVMSVDRDQFKNVVGLIASPPCPAFSAAGNKGAVGDIPLLVEALHSDTFGSIIPSELDDPKNSLMSISPFVWAEHLEPEWITLEQVPAVLPIWEAGAQMLRRRGYSAWAGVLNAANYGVPQKRMRAFMIASKTRKVHPPEATHAEDPQPSLFGDELLPWVSAWSALAANGVAPGSPILRNGHPNSQRGQTFNMATRPAPCLAFGKNQTEWKWLGFPRLDDLGTSEHGYRDRDLHDVDGPAPTMTEKARSMSFHSEEWLVNTGLDWKKGGTRDDAQKRPLSEPAPTMTGVSGRQWQWTQERPATTVMGDPRLWPPGHKVNKDDIDRMGKDAAEVKYGDRAGSGAIQMTIEQASVLQTFPVDYQWQGSKTASFVQVGNAVPPLLAWHVLNTVVGDTQ